MYKAVMFHEGFQVQPTDEHENRYGRRGDGDGEKESAPVELSAQAAQESEPATSADD